MKHIPISDALDATNIGRLTTNAASSKYLIRRESFKLSNLPICCAQFIAHNQWFVVASDDMKIRIYNYNTMEKIREVEAHQHYIRLLEVRPYLPYVLSCSHDVSIKLWDWNQEFECTQFFPTKFTAHSFDSRNHSVCFVQFFSTQSYQSLHQHLTMELFVFGLPPLIKQNLH